MANNYVELVLPWPPSVNHYWGTTRLKTGGVRRYISHAGVNFAEECGKIIAACTIGRKDLPYLGSVAIKIDLFPPDRRQRDIDNVLKPLFDVLKKFSVIDDDKQIDRLVMERWQPVKGGRCRLFVTSILNEEDNGNGNQS